MIYEMKFMKTTIFMAFFVLFIPFTLTACSGGNSTSSSTFPNITDEEIPDILEKTVGTVGNVSFTSGISDNKDYTSVLSVVFNDTTESDYTALMKHYQSESTGTDESGFLLFDWGRLSVTADDSSICINALIK